MTWSPPERRHRRSDNKTRALEHQLEHTKRRGRLEAVVLADNAGLVLAEAGDPDVCAELGAIAPLYSRTGLPLPLHPLLEGSDLAVRPMSLWGQDLFLATTGGSAARDALLSHSVQGVQRILETN